MNGSSIDPRIKLRHITCFLEVARAGSVGRAATLLRISQPAVSKTLQELEQLLGVALFDRSRRTLVLTDPGETFLRYAGASVSALRQGLQSVVSGPDTHAVTVPIGALPTASVRLLPAAVAHFTQQALGMRPRVVTGPNAFLLSQLRVGAVDIVIGRMAEPALMTGFSFEPLYSEDVAFVVRPGHPLLAAEPFDFAAIERFQVLMPPPDAAIRTTVDRFLVGHGIGLVRDQIETVSDAFGLAYTAATDAIWIISEGVVAEAIDQGRLMRLPIDTAATVGPVGLTLRTDTELPLPAKLFIRSVRAVVGEPGGTLG
ncbi:pca operon transcription factor PcaQ [Segnochrobactrum spirostomi]|uniref:Pca operon transcription factor PcaQ n=1 Tax=Segnochrobactrum spirostomi TaxID=2608987 RepID=A0A6A7XZF6_9HYPH|nr:pca operon transcription factor PcaQ [Segnochrobactrum spirostomi]MQT11696.1 pca operon transcription factor PcaQ [Segnochrobactrum spirostomi]